MKNLLTFMCRHKISFILHVFIEILQGCCKLVIYGTLGMPDYAHPKWYLRNLNFCVYLQEKKSTLSPLFFWRYCTDMQTSYFGYFGHVWLINYSKKISVLISMSKTNFIIHFPEILDFNESCNLIGQQHFGP